MNRPRQPIEHRLLLGLVVLKLLMLAVLGSRYGFHRDELYYLVGGRHLDLGYVDHPFVVPWLARLAESLSGLSVLGLRLFSTIASAAVVYLAGLMTANLGGGRPAQLLAGLAALTIPFHLLTQNLFQTVPIDTLTWALASLFLIVLLRTGDSRWWLAFGAVAGVGMLTKYTFLAFGAAVVVGLIATPARRELLRPSIYLGGVLALLILLPNLLWQIEHGWPTLEFIANNGARNRFPPLPFLSLQLVFLGPFSLPIVIAGFLYYFDRTETRFRPLGVAAAFVFLGFLLAQSKPYYTAAIYPLLLAGGAVWLEKRSVLTPRPRPRLRVAWPYLLLLGNLMLAPIFTPLLPVSTYARVHDGFPHREFGEMFGWPELVETVADAYHALPVDVRERTVLLAGNYGAAGALDLLGAERGLPPVLCFQNSYYYWSRTDPSRPQSIDSVIVVSLSRETVESLFADVQELGVITNHEGIDNEEANRSFFLASRPKVSLDELAERLRSFH